MHEIHFSFLVVGDRRGRFVRLPRSDAPVPDTIRAEGVPPVPAAVRQALNRYQNIRSASFQDWASDGQGMYIIDPVRRRAAGALRGRAWRSAHAIDVSRRAVGSVVARPRHDQFLYVDR